MRQRDPLGSASFDRSPSVFACYLDSNEGALERDRSTVPIYIRVAGCQVLFCTSLRSFRTSQVNLRGTLGGLGKDRNAVA